MKSHDARQQPPSPLRALFARYMAGEIEEPLWKEFMAAIDAKESRPLERRALIAFMHDAFLEKVATARWPSRRLLPNCYLAEVIAP